MNDAAMFGILNAAEEGIVAFDLDGQTLCCNAAACALLQLDGASFFDVSDLPDAVHAFLGGVRSGESTMIDLYGHAVRLRYQDVRSDGMRIAAVLTLTDVGEQHRVERIRREFTANVTHELKTPLTSISGYAEMIENGMAKNADIRAFAERIRRESNRMLTLVSEILTLSELDESDIRRGEEPVDLYALAEQYAETLKSEAMLHGVTVQVSGKPTAVIGNRTLLSELVYNLMDNAIRYNRDNGTVSVRVGDGTFAVRDTGIGIPKKLQSKVFERFYRVDGSRRNIGGTGLGLAIVKHVCEQYGAQIELKSAEGIGTEITVTFPPQQT